MENLEKQASAEFLHAAGAKLVQSDLVGEWETRVKSDVPGSLNHAEVKDGGHTLPVPISAAITSNFFRACSLQSLVTHRHKQSWRGVEASTAINGSRMLLVIQIARFDDGGCKVHGTVSAGPQVHIPCFTDASCHTSLEHMR